MSTQEIEKVSLPKGRKQTDKSLGAERATTDKSLWQGRQRSKRKTDDAVLNKRIELDDARLQTRHDVDNWSESQKNAPGGSRSSDRIDAEHLLLEERQIADEALENERRHADSILQHERDVNGPAEQKRFEAERKKTDTDLTNERTEIDAEVLRAAVALTTRDEFLAIVSHDLRNPLGSISMAIDLLMASESYAASNKDTRDYLNMISRNAAEALRLIGDLMDMERIAAGKLGLEIGRHDINEMIQHTVKSFQPHAKIKELSLRFSSQHRSGMVMCDRDRITQVLSNLIGNAIKFTPAGGEITVAVQTEGEETMISVADTGPGIAENMRKTVFNRFSQIAKHDRKGLGLGLYISKMILEVHQGRLWVDSTIGKGSTFFFTLPSGS